jgi:hypothetical protein
MIYFLGILCHKLLQGRIIQSGQLKRTHKIREQMLGELHLSKHRLSSDNDWEYTFSTINDGVKVSSHKTSKILATIAFIIVAALSSFLVRCRYILSRCKKNQDLNYKGNRIKIFLRTLHFSTSS